MILVTGGAGFIGSNIVNALCARGDTDIVVCDRLRKSDKWRNIAKSEVADVVAPEQVFDFLATRGDEVTAIIHMGAISSTIETDADLIIANNFKLSLALWEWCAAHDSQFIFASSAATYGDGAAGFDDDMSIDALARLRPLNPYGWSKHLFDRRVARLVSRGAPQPRQWAGLKFFNVYGPNEYHKGSMKSVVAQIFPDVAAGNPVRLFRSHRDDYRDGEQQRDFVYVNDCVDVVLWLLDQPLVQGTFNLGTGTARTFLDLANAVYGALDTPPDIEFIDTPESIRERYQYFTEAPMGRLRAAGYRAPFTSLEEGVADYVRYYLNMTDPYR
jgi:ADP-L-glycero-D-manno-heptose 6-epimerase